jgi:hypothetical protein
MLRLLMIYFYLKADVSCEFRYCSFKTIKRARFLRTSIMEPLGGNSLLFGQSALRVDTLRLLKPRADPPIRVDRREQLPAVAALTMNNDALILRQIS